MKDKVKKGAGFPALPFDLGRTGGDWVKGTRGTGDSWCGSMKAGKKKGKKKNGY